MGRDPELRKTVSGSGTTITHSVSSTSFSHADYGSSLNGFEYNENLTDGGSSEEVVTNQRDGFIMICNQFLNYGLDNRGNYEIDPVFGYKIHKDMTYVAGRDVFDASSYGTISKYVASHIEGGYEPGSFLVTNLTSVISQYKQWTHELPMVEPHYAVKCNPDPVILRLLASLGCSFDCATMGEIDLVLNGLGNYCRVSPDSIVYANPAKMNHMIQFAMDNEVRLTVFDGEDELYKLAGVYGCDSKLDLMIRLDTTGADCVCNLTNKFGCPVTDAPRLLSIAQKLGLNVVGVCFHVGSGCRNAKAYTNALRDTCLVFKAAKALGMNDLYMVDIGGGFPGATGGYGGPDMPTFQDMAATIREAIVELKQNISTFQSTESLRFIAEPGRYFASAATSLATKVYSRKGGEKNDVQILYIDDGIYGSFNNIIYDHATPEPTKITLNGVSTNNNNNGMNTVMKNDKGNMNVNANTTTTGGIGKRAELTRSISPSTEEYETNLPVTTNTANTTTIAIDNHHVTDDDHRKVSDAAAVYKEKVKFSPLVSNHSNATAILPPSFSNTTATATAAITQPEETMSTIVFGPTCDGLDQICDGKTHLPRCKVGDWLLFDNMGAYTHTASFVFNGYTHIPNKIHIVI